MILSSQKSGEIEYDEHLAQRLFCRAIERGIESAAILHEVKPLLKEPKVSDEDLLDITQRAAVDDKERKLIFQQKRSARVQSIESDNSTSSSTLPKEDASNLKVMNGITASLAAITKQLTVLTKEVDMLKKVQPPPKVNRFGCKQCQEQDKRCTHCYVCGELGHRGRECAKGKGKDPSGEGKGAQ